MRVELLADHNRAIPALAQWFFDEWRDYYGPLGLEAAMEDLQACCNRDALPIGLVVVKDGVVCGTAALKPESITTHRHLGPWLAALLVAPWKRGQGVGGMLIEAIEVRARQLGCPAIYTGTGAARLFERAGWMAPERVVYHRQEITIFQRELTGVA